MSLARSLEDLLVGELDAHVGDGRRIAGEPGEDDRPPLTSAQRWRFTGHTVLRRALVDGHPAVAAFDRHCYRGVLDRRRFTRAVDLFEEAAAAAKDHGIAVRLAVTRSLLEPVVQVGDGADDEVVLGGLWHALATIALSAGVRGPAEYPDRGVMCDRLVAVGLLDPGLGRLAAAAGPDNAPAVAKALLDLLEPDVPARRP